LAACWSRCGMLKAAEEVLSDLKSRHPQVKVRIAGEDRELFAGPQGAAAWLQSLGGPPRNPAAGDGWPMYRGDPTRNLASQAGAPLLHATALLPACGDETVREKVEELRKESVEKYRVAIPKLYPLVVGDTILARTATHLVALDFAGGKTLWEAPLDDPLRFLLEGKNQDAGALQTDAFKQAVRRRFWEDLTFGACSSDGHLVFGVEDVPFGVGAEYQRMAVGPDGRRRLDGEASKRHNLLAAYDIRTGKLKWEIGGSPGPGMRPLAGTLFLGPPLPLGGRLYTVGETDKETRLLELDAESGELLSSLTLVSRDVDPQFEMQMMFNMSLAMLVGDAARRGGVSPSFADGVLVCPAGDRKSTRLNSSH